MDMETIPGASWATRTLQTRRNELLDTLSEDKLKLVNQLNLGRSRTLGGTMDDEVYAQNRDLILAIGEQHVDELLQIETALHRIDSGTWGDCAECGKLIEADRLTILPTASRCIKCQSASEATVDCRDKTPSI